MSYKPSDFFISLMEFFSIFLPGFIVAFVWTQEIQLVFPMVNASGSSFSWYTFYFIASYVIGHFVYGAGGFLLEAIRPFRLLFVRRWEVKKAVNIMHEQIIAIVNNDEKNDRAKIARKEVMWFQKWADSVIQIKHSELLATIRQFEADAKFFRSFVVVSLIGLVHSIIVVPHKVQFWWVGCVVIAIFLHFYWKFEAIKEASNVIIAMDSLGEFKSESPSVEIMEGGMIA